MARIPFRKLLPHIALLIAALILLGGLLLLASGEQKKTRDIVRVQEVLGIRSSLRMYYIDHAAYPAAPISILLGVGDSARICDRGFVAKSSDSCAKKAYGQELPSGHHLLPDDEYAYVSLTDNGIDACTSPAGCPHFAIQFLLETDMLYPRGAHVLTDQGIK
ncbi:hypothetical protein HY732_02085 [Candidatus Uhrbacteria bacterium]|nr:hypothetical protein [Candidatus Uhrbacteria bacterium]